MPTDTVYGEKCHLCGHLRGLHRKDVMVPSSPCDDCLDCQYDPFVAFLQKHLTLEMFDPEVREASRAIRNGQDHPLAAELRAEVAKEERIEWMGAEWFVAESRYDGPGGGTGGHWHLTLTRPGGEVADEH